MRRGFSILVLVIGVVVIVVLLTNGGSRTSNRDNGISESATGTTTGTAHAPLVVTTDTGTTSVIPNIGCPAGDTQVGYGCEYQGRDPAENPSGQVNPTNCPSGMSPEDGGCLESSSGSTFSTGSASSTNCGTDLHAGPHTSCAFAEAVENAWADSSHALNEIVSAHSSITGKTYSMSCVSTAHLVTCTGGVDAVVAFGPPAASGGTAPSGTTTASGPTT